MGKPLHGTVMDHASTQRLAFPEAFRTLVGKNEAHDRLDRLETVLPRYGQAQRRAVLPRQRLPVNTGDEEGKLVRGLGDRQSLNIRPGIPTRPLPRRNRRIVKSFHLQVFGAGQGFGEVDQGLHGKTAPRHRHGPRLDAAVPVKPFLQGHPFQQIVDIDGERLFDHALDSHLPGSNRQPLGGVRDALVRAEFVKVVVAGGELFGGQRPIHPIAFVARDRIKERGGIPGPGSGHGYAHSARLGRAKHDRRRKDEGPCADGLQDASAVDENVLRRCRGLRQFPAVFFLDVHGWSPRTEKARTRATPGPPSKDHAGHCSIPATTGSQR